jgi:hypothetical protein
LTHFLNLSLFPKNESSTHTLPKGIVPLMENVPTMENAAKFVTHTKQPARYAISPTLDKYNTNLKIVWASILMMSRSYQKNKNESHLAQRQERSKANKQ